MKRKTFFTLIGLCLTLMFIGAPSYAAEYAPLVVDEEMFGPGYLLLLIPICVMFAFVLFGSMQTGKRKQAHTRFMRQYEMQEQRFQEEKQSHMSSLERELQRSNLKMRQYMAAKPTEKEYV